jgi:chromate transporter
MIGRGEALFEIARHCLVVSVLAVGGTSSVLPEMHRTFVENLQWLSDRDFAAYYAIGQAAPGPNMMIVPLIGWHVAGLAGVLVSTLMFCGPPSVMIYLIAGAWDRYRHARWRIVVQSGLIPVTIGLVCASALVVAQASDASLVAVAITLATAALTFFTRINPLWALAAAALLGLAGVV